MRDYEYEERGKAGSFGVGLLIGAVAGAVAGILFAPKSGKENREMMAQKAREMKDKFQEKWESGEIQEKARKVFGEVSDRSIQMYREANREMHARVNQMRNMSYDEYKDIVTDVVENVRKGANGTTEQMKKLYEGLIAEWGTVKTKSNGEGRRHAAKDEK
ncbi:YtxH domain-containing protein [Candidatus Roizmanbacteria bacterium]|nr:YtxH domain-containing protein [Candidatus Roizmanbacteria bacterium]